MIGNIVKKNFTKQTKTVSSSPTTTQTVTPDSGKQLTQVTVNKLTASTALGDAKVSEVAEGKTFSSMNGIKLTGTAPIIPTAHIYGVEWAGGTSPSMTRTDAAANFSNPVPYYLNMSATPQSPFDGLYPWSGMGRATSQSGGEIVSIPKYYYKWTKTGIKMKLQIADGYVPGFSLSPIHANVGRDIVYVGRYHCGSDYKSTTNVFPGTTKTRAAFRTGIHNLGNDAWQWDYAMYWTIAMLYLVEYANWDVQSTIGAGASVSYTTYKNGLTDSMPYHTGTIKSSRATYGAGVQYRYIEDLWANVMDWVDGINIIDTNKLYCITNPNYFADDTTTNATYIGPRFSTNGFIKSYNIPNISGFEYALYPSAIDTNTGINYVRDFLYDAMTSSTGILKIGGCAVDKEDYGLFHFETRPTSEANSSTGSRLMVF